MISDRVVESTLSACAAQFPRRCSCCHREFPSFGDFLATCTPIGLPLLDAIDDDEDPVGALSFANCVCKTTIAIRYEDTSDHLAFNQAIFAEAAATCRTEVDVLAELIATVQGLASHTGPSMQHTHAERDADLLEIGAALRSIVDANTLQLPKAPTAALRVRALALDENTELGAIAEAVATDPGISVAVLRASNAAAFARHGEVTSLLVAVSRLGRRRIADIAMSTGVSQAMIGQGPFVSQRHLLWRRSVLTGLLARGLAARRGLQPDDAFVAGLFSSLGALVGTLAIEKLLLDRTTTAARPWRWWLRLLDMFGGEFGRSASRNWGLPSLLADVASEPNGANIQEKPYVALLAAASRVATLSLDRQVVTVDLLARERVIPEEDRAFLVQALPQAVGELVDFVGPSAPLHPNGAVSSDEATVLAPPIRSIAASVNDESWVIAGIGNNRLALTGHQVLAETSIVAVEVDVEPPLKFWAITTPMASMKPPHLMAWPFALEPETLARLRGLASEHAEEGVPRH